MSIQTKKGNFKMPDKLKTLTMVMKFFAVTSYVQDWYMTAIKDREISIEELTTLGAGICEILGLKTAIKLEDDNGKK